MKKWFPIVVACTIVLFECCIQPPDYPVEPVIEYIRMNKDTLNQGQGYTDTLSVTFSFTDGDGDLGFPETDPTGSVFIIDSRDGFPKDTLQLPYVEPQGAGNGISGEITVFLPTSCCIYKNSDGIVESICDDVPNAFIYDTLRYLIKIRDRAGHESKPITTDIITLDCHH